MTREKVKGCLFVRMSTSPFQRMVFIKIERHPFLVVFEDVVCLKIVAGRNQ